jgi:hypothetical protein
MSSGDSEELAGGPERPWLRVRTSHTTSAITSAQKTSIPKRGEPIPETGWAIAEQIDVSAA